MTGRIMVIGLGELGFHILQILAHTPGVSEIVAADVDEKIGLLKTNNAIYAAAHLDLYPNIKFRRMNLFNIEETTEILKEEEPVIVCNATTLQSWWVFHLLPGEVFRKLNFEGGIGPQTPFHLTLTYKLMQAVRKAGVNIHVVNCSYSDAVNTVLGKVGLAPTVGGGNFDLLIPGIKQFVSRELGVPMRSVTVFMAAHHGLLTSHMNAPFWIKILVYDKDVSSKFPLDKIREALRPFVQALMSGGEEWKMPPNEDIAASFTKNILGIYFNTGELHHAPGPLGLPGGYPIRLSAKGVEVVLPEGLTLDEAIKVNEECGRYDGIEKIKDDGTMIFTEKAVKTYRETLGYECEELKISESEEKAKELNKLFKKIAEKYGVKIPV